VHASGGGEALNSFHYVAGSLLQARDPLGLTCEGACEDAAGQFIEMLDDGTYAEGKVDANGNVHYSFVTEAPATQPPQRSPTEAVQLARQHANTDVDRARQAAELNEVFRPAQLLADLLGLQSPVHNPNIDWNGDRFVPRSAMDAELASGSELYRAEYAAEHQRLSEMRIGIVPGPGPGGAVEGAAMEGPVVVRPIIRVGGASRGGGPADFVVGSEGTAVPTSQARMRAGFDRAGIPSRPATGSAEAGRIHTVDTPHGPVEVRTMEGGAHHPRRVVTSRPGTNDPVRVTGERYPNGTPRAVRRAGAHLEQTP
jgi:hypothetical protein